MAIMSDGVHRIPFDQVVSVMQQTGKDLPSIYRETSRAGLPSSMNKAKNHRKNSPMGEIKRTEF
jgi:L-serine dehydratase